MRMRAVAVSLLGAAALALAVAAPAALAAVTPTSAWKLLATTAPTNLAPVQSEVQRVTVEAADGTYTLSFGSETTSPIDFDADASTVQAALEALPALGAGSVTVTGGPGGDAEGPYFVAFDGAGFQDEDVATLVPDGEALVGRYASAHVTTTVPGGEGTGYIGVSPVNVGGAASAGMLTLKLGPLPAGITLAGEGEAKGGGNWTCTGAAGESEAQCTFKGTVTALVAPGTVRFPIKVGALAAAASQVPVRVEELGGKAAETEVPITVSSIPAASGIGAFWAGAFEADGTPSTQAGGHPFSAVTSFTLNTVRAVNGKIVPAGDAREIDVDLPAGFLGNPLATARCKQSEVSCEGESKVGRFTGENGNFGGSRIVIPIDNVVPVFGAAAEFTTKVASPLQTLLGHLRAEEDFGVRIVAPNSATTVNKLYSTLASLEGFPVGAHGAPFLRNPTDCAQQREESEQGRGPATKITADTWQEPGVFSPVKADPLPLLTGCAALTRSWVGNGPEPAEEEPSFSFQPTTTQGSSPTGATATLHIPQRGLSSASDPERLATSDLKKAVVTLPAGLSLNPSSAAGLQACSEAQIGYRGSSFASPSHIRFNEAAPACPDASKLGTVEAESPLLEEALSGTIYLAAQDQNPFGSLLALYLVIDSPRFGVTVKLAGEVHIDEASGQMTATFDDNPQLPVEELRLHFRGGGPRSELATPEVCGHYASTGALTPWSAEHGEAAAIAEPGFTVGARCAASSATRPFHPSFELGTVDPIAGAYSPLVLKLGRADGEQELRRLDFTLPPGVTGRLAGVPYCPDAQIAAAAAKAGREEQAAPSCPGASQIGTVDTAAGVGPAPLHVGGAVYLAGPYEGAPISTVVITPAVAGPFDLGTVVVRAPLFVNPETAQITGRSDPIPTQLKGIRLKLRSVTIQVNRQGFTLNPTNCEAMAAGATLTSSDGAVATPTNRFQVGGCKDLKFKPKLKIQLKGATKRIGHPALKAVLTYPKQGTYANIRRAQVNLPHAEFLDQGNLNKTCTKPVLLAGNCPESSIYGKAKAWTPLLEKPLQGPVYLVGGYGYKLPALVADLNGQIRVTLVGKVDSGKNKGIRNTFEVVPDAPVSRFVLEMKGGKKYGLLENSENLCKAPKSKRRAIVRFTGQNGKVDNYKPVVANQCKTHKKKSRSGHGKHRKG